MSRADAWMPLYIGDYMGDTAHLSTEQHGAYLLLLMHQWRRGSIPTDEASLAQITRSTPARWRNRIAPVVMAFFTMVDGALVQRRLLDEMEKAKKKSQEAAQSAASRWNKNKHAETNDIRPEADANASNPHIPSQCSSPSPSPIKEESVGPAVLQVPSGTPDLFSAPVTRLKVADDTEAAVAAWNAMAARCNLPQVAKLSDARRRSLLARLREAGGIEGWHAALKRIEASSFLLGDNAQGWVMDFDAAINLNKFTKLMEGAYDNRPSRKSPAKDAMRLLDESLGLVRPDDPFGDFHTIDARSFG